MSFEQDVTLIFLTSAIATALALVLPLLLL